MILIFSHCRSWLFLLLPHFYISFVASVSHHLSLFELFPCLTPVKTSIIISPTAPTCHESAVIETLIIPHKMVHGWKTERKRQGPISISAAAQLPGVPGGPWDLIWRRVWELKSYLSRFIAEEWPCSRTLFMHWISPPANHCGYYKSCTIPTYCQTNARIYYWFSLHAFFFSFSPNLEEEVLSLLTPTVCLKMVQTDTLI